VFTTLVRYPTTWLLVCFYICLPFVVAISIPQSTMLNRIAAAVATTYTITGRVDDQQSHPIAGVTIADDAGHSTTTDVLGAYELSGLAAGTYTITATKTIGPYFFDYFTPITRTVTLPPAASGQDFLGQLIAVDYGISGCVTDASGTPIAGVTITVDGVGHGFSTATDSGGCYSFFPVEVGSYTLVPSKPSYTFVPTSRTVTLPDGPTNADFIGFELKVWSYLPLLRK
jgi:Carboxypeptidase regulatory-like domain